MSVAVKHQTRIPEAHLALHAGSPDPFQAVLRYPLLAILPVVVLVSAALALGLVRAPHYSAGARLVVGSLTPGENSAPGAVDANQQLASAFARAINAEAVVRAVSRRTGRPRPEVARALYATPVPNSPIVAVTATADRGSEAVAIAQAATGALVAYVRSLGSRDRGAEQELRRYEEAQAELAMARQRYASSGTESAKAALNVARLKLKASERSYLEQAQAGGPPTPVAVLNRAGDATSDRAKKLRLFLVIGAVAGVFLGVAFATAWGARRQRDLVRGVG